MYMYCSDYREHTLSYPQFTIQVLVCETSVYLLSCGEYRTKRGNVPGGLAGT